MLKLPTYVLITAARDEAKFIELTIKSVVSQTARPLKWVIVSDGSTDATDNIVRKYAAEYPWIELVRMPERRERHFAGKVHAFRSKWVIVSDGSTDATDNIVRKYAAEYPWIELVRMPERRERHFAGKVHAFNAGYGRVRDLEYEVIGNLDGDVSFDDQEFFSSLLGKLAEDPTLGVVGTSFKQGGRYVYDYRFVNIEHVSGPCQLFRRECFEEIGGYVPVKTGGVDVIAVVAARMKGWKTKTFTHTWFQLHREMGALRGDLLGARFRNGIKDYTLGNHPIWELLRTAYQMAQRPFVIGAMALACGYVWALMRGAERVVSPEMQAFRRREDRQRLRRIVTAKANWPCRLPQERPA